MKRYKHVAGSQILIFRLFSDNDHKLITTTTLIILKILLISKILQPLIPIITPIIISIMKME